MKILGVTESTGWSGGANQAWLTALELKRRGVQLAFACPDTGELATRLKAAGIPVFDFRSYQDYDLSAALRLARLSLDWGADLLHAHHPRGHAMALIAAYKTGLPVVVTRQVNNPIPRHPFSKFKYLSSKIKRYIAVSGAVAAKLTDAGVEPERVRVIPACIDVERWAPARAAHEKPAPGAPVILMLAHYAEFKGQDLLVKAAPLVLAKRPDVRFRFAGRETEKLKPLAESLGVASRVELLGERHDILELLSAASVLAMPSRQEGLGIAAMEAHASGVPVVAAAVGGLPEVVQDKQTGLLVPPEDPAALAQALLYLLDHPEKGRALSRLGLELVRARFGVESVTGRIQQVYQEALSSVENLVK